MSATINGQTLGEQSLQVVGEFTWTTKYNGNRMYEVTGTGTAKISMNNNVIDDINCAGARDIYSFELAENKDVRSVKAIETGCPQGTQLDNSARQMSIDPLSATAFILTVVEQSEGNRAVANYTFAK